MQLFFLRHAQAEDSAASDFQRNLTERGRKRTRTAAQVMQNLGLQFDYVFSSPRIRARQTADIVAEVMGFSVKEREEVDFGFSVQHVSKMIANLSYSSSVMFVGHNPSMSTVVNELTGATVSMKKGGLARVDLIGRRPMSGELVWLIAPKVFDALKS